MREAAWFIVGQSRSAPAGLLGTLARSVVAAAARWRLRTRLAKLDELDDHLLFDIGLTREDLRSLDALPWSADPGLDLHRRAEHNRRRGWCA